MNEISNFNNFVMMSGDKLVTDSRKVAKHFKKQHKDVLRAHDNLKCSDEFNQRNFAPIEYLDSRGRKMRSIEMTKNGFVMLAMGFTGNDATKFKETYIAAFDAIADQLANRDKNLWQKMQALIAKEIQSEIKASFGSHLMLSRKREIPHFRDERSQLESEIQQPLFLN